MNTSQAPVLIALLCDARGIIQDVIRDGHGVEGLNPGQPLGQSVDASSRIKLLNFLVELRDKGAAFDWEINIPSAGQVITLRLAGVLGGNNLMIVGAPTSQDALNLCDELMKIDSEQATALQTAIKGQMQTTRFQSEGDAAIYDGISRLNNELVTLQRDPAKKNAELERLYAEVQRLAITDLLTHLYNRRGLIETGQREVTRAKRFNHPLAAIMFDLDHFKAVNDAYGHVVGDKVLEETAARCCRQLRQLDVFGRYGGDEFAILLPEADLVNARGVAERLRRAADEPIDTGQGTLTVTISLGVTVLRDNTSDLQDLLQSADRALYEAKTSGRNRVCAGGE